MKILLLYPEYPDTFWSFKHVLKFISKKAAFPPLGLMTIASMLPETWEKRLVDTNVETLKEEQIQWSDLVFIGAMIVQKNNAQELITKCKELGKKVIAGGPVFTTQHQNFENVDHFILNEAEVTLPLFLEDLKNKTLKPMYTSTHRPDVTTTPIPDWSLINMKKYATMSVQYSRGCPFNCEFCDIIIMNGRVPRVKSPVQIIKEFQALYDANWRGSVFVVDDNFIGNKVEAKNMLRQLIGWQKQNNYPFQLITEASTNLADDQELMELMSKANFYKVFLGIETPDVDSLKECGKFQNITRDLKDAVTTIQQHGMQVMGGFIVGFDNDKESIFQTQVDFIQKTGIVTAMVGLLNALPQTRLWHRLKEENRLLSQTTGANTDGSLNFIPKMNKEKLINGYKHITQTIYSHKEYYKRIQTFINNYKPTVRSTITRNEIQAFLRSIWKIGIISNARVQYWKLILNTLITKNKSFPMAIELAIIGEHFKKTFAQL